MFFYIARQPILKRNKSLYAYELLFRNGTNNAFPDVSPEAATANLIENSQFQLNIADITNGHLGFINFSEQAILDDLPSVMPKESLVIEVLETVPPTLEIFTALRSLKSRGYMIALDDYDFNTEWNQILDIIDIIKVDLQASTREQTLSLFSLTKQYKVEFLAEKVETHEEFQACL